MNWLNRMERRMGRFYLRNIMLYLCIAMAGVYVLEWIPTLQSPTQLLAFYRDLILQGQVWRVITFIFLPPSGSLISVALHLYFFWFIGTALENQWGSRRFTLYYGIGILCNIAAGFLSGYATNYYLNLTLILAFAVLYSEMQVNLFYVLPVKMKWIGIIDGLYLIYQFIVARAWSARLGMILSLAPFLVFFGPQAWALLGTDIRRLFRR